jgi:anthranilate synthase component 1
MDAATLDHLRGDYDVIPIVRALNLRADPLELLAASISDQSFLFEFGRFAYLGLSPRASLTFDRSADEPVRQLRSALQPLRVYPSDSLPPFFGGAVGFLGYGVARWLERLPDRHPPQAIPEAELLFFDEVIVFDRETGSVSLIVNLHTGSSGTSAELLTEATRRLEAVSGMLEVAATRARTIPATRQPSSWTSNCSREQFESAVRRAKEEIAAGEAFQIVVAQRWETPYPTSDAVALYQALRRINPSPYMFLLRMREATLVGSSPEMLVRVTGDTVETRPIAGTRPRGQSAAEDAALEAELLANEKENAEHLMLVDLGRNDLGRVSRRGSVKVTEFRTIERYSHVMHIVSHVVGSVRKEMLPVDALLAAFPAGTVTGAPKIRAMELIDELEFSRRGPYAGALFYASYAGDLDSCIAIRAVVLHDDRAYVQAGAGIVYDSDPAREYEETVSKAAAMQRAVEEAIRMTKAS